MIKTLRRPWIDKNYGQSYFVCSTKEEIPSTLLKFNDKCYEITSGQYYKVGNGNVWEIDDNPIYIKVADDIRLTSKEVRKNGV